MVQVVVNVSVRDLTDEDLAWCSWAGTGLHLTVVAGELERARRGAVDYLAVCPPSGRPVAIGGIDFEADPGRGRSTSSACIPRWSPAASGPS
jgi:hypothetical protein